MGRRDVDAMIIIDSNVFIFGETIGAPEREDAIAMYKKAVEEDRVVTNTIIISEVFHFAQKIIGREGAFLRVRDIIGHPSIDFFELGPETVLRAARLSRDFQMRINDALIAQQAIETGAAVLTDNLKDFSKIKAIRVIPMRSAQTKRR